MLIGTGFISLQNAKSRLKLKIPWSSTSFKLDTTAEPPEMVLWSCCIFFIHPRKKKHDMFSPCTIIHIEDVINHLIQALNVFVSLNDLSHFSTDQYTRSSWKQKRVAMIKAEKNKHDRYPVQKQVECVCVRGAQPVYCYIGSALANIRVGTCQQSKHEPGVMLILRRWARRPPLAVYYRDEIVQEPPVCREILKRWYANALQCT